MGGELLSPYERRPNIRARRGGQNGGGEVSGQGHAGHQEDAARGHASALLLGHLRQRNSQFCENDSTKVKVFSWLI